MKHHRPALAFLCVLAMTGCATHVPANLMQPAGDQLKLREQQSRRYETTDQTELLSASAALLQDMGFSIDEINKDLGVITASKMRSAVNPAQQAAAVMILLISAAGKNPQMMPTDKEQQMRAGVVVRPLGDGKNSVVRVTFQRTVWNTEGKATTQEMLGSDEIYTEFFDKLSKAIFLQAHDL